MPMFEAIITDPPNSGEIRDRVAEMIKDGLATRWMDVEVQPVQEVPSPQPQAITFQVGRTMLSAEAAQVGGSTSDGGTIVVQCSADRSVPATARIVTP